MVEDSWTLAIETGGTFTDLFVVGPDGMVYTDKVPSTPAAPAQAAAAALDRCLGIAQIAPTDITRVLHGSTVAVNALIERRAPRPALITTRGFRDVLFIGRQEKTHIYDMFYTKPAPFIDRAHAFEVGGRIAADGAEVEPIDPDDVARVVDDIIRHTGASSVAVCLLHSYANPAHEQCVEDVVRARHPDVRVVLSSRVCPVHREFERASTTVINAYLHPVVDRYLGDFAQIVENTGCRATPLIMQANGGVAPVAASRRRPAGLFLSGPSAAVAGAAALARQVGLGSMITLDVGGTSTDICLVTDGEAHETGHGGSCGHVQGQPLNMVMTDIVTIGAGGGSLAWRDAGGMLNVGPHSAGADPGPACYGRGGEGFTLTDALVCLGLLADGATLAGGIALSRAAAVRAGAALATSLGIAIDELAHSVYRVAAANMAEAIRSVTVRRGFDPRNYALFACGGAGPLVAGPLAEELDMDEVLVPPDPGVFSAFGLTAAGLRMDFTRAVEEGSRIVANDVAFAAVIDALHAQASAAFQEVGVATESLTRVFTADARYLGQGFELRVPFEPDDGPQGVITAFHAAHAQRYGHAFPDQGVELTALRLNASLPSPGSPSKWRTGESGYELIARPLSFPGVQALAPVTERASLNAGDRLVGPALSVEPTTTTYVPAGWQAAADTHGLLRLTRLEAS